MKRTPDHFRQQLQSPHRPTSFGMSDERLEASRDLIEFVKATDTDRVMAQRNMEMEAGLVELQVSEDTLLTLFLSDHPDARTVCLALERILQSQ